MKDDVETPARPPAKRRQLEDALDLWLAVWLSRDDLTPSERRRVEEEKARRRSATARSATYGFTGTQAGMTPAQRAAVREIVAGATEAHHGDCVGADEQFHSICRGLGIPVVLHPPDNGAKRAFCKGAIRAERVKPYLERDRDIVRVTSELVATPKEMREPTAIRAGGTWFTIRYAWARGSPVRVVLPDGLLLAKEK